MVTLELADTGPGLGTSRNGRSGIGLANTRARLEQLYGDAAALRLENGPRRGAVATVTLPLERQGTMVAA